VAERCGTIQCTWKNAEPCLESHGFGEAEKEV